MNDPIFIADETSARTFVSRLPGVDAEALARLDRLVAMLREENSRQNLVSQASLDAAWQRHIADSAQLLSWAPAGWGKDADVPTGETRPWLDLGTGAGFPRLVIAALRPQLEVVMVESRARRIAWLESVCAELGLSAAQIVGSRLELVSAFPCAVISARAFAPLERLLAVSARFSTSTTRWLLPKGRSARQELHNLVGWDHVFHVEHSRTDPEAGIIVGHLLGREADTGHGKRAIKPSARPGQTAGTAGKRR